MEGKQVKFTSLANKVSFNADGSGLSPISVKQWDCFPELLSSHGIKAELKQHLNDFLHLNTWGTAYHSISSGSFRMTSLYYVKKQA